MQNELATVISTLTFPKLYNLKAETTSISCPSLKSCLYPQYYPEITPGHSIDFSIACSGGSLNFFITTDAFSPAYKCSRLYHPQTNQFRAKQIPSFRVLLPLLLTTKLLERAVCSLSLLPNLPLTPQPSTPPKPLLYELLYLNSKDWKCVDIDRPLLLKNHPQGLPHSRN